MESYLQEIEKLINQGLFLNDRLMKKSPKVFLCFSCMTSNDIYLLYEDGALRRIWPDNSPLFFGFDKYRTQNDSSKDDIKITNPSTRDWSTFSYNAGIIIDKRNQFLPPEELLKLFSVYWNKKWIRLNKKYKAIQSSSDKSYKDDVFQKL